jgi:2,4-diaminopentanoate dehydrogenase
VEIAVRWPQGPDPRSDWTIQQDAWVIEVVDRPTVTMTVGLLPFPDFEATTHTD